jgi:large subunit ribosomal protein L9
MTAAIQVILTEDSMAGKAGQLKKVRPGYARNYLFPKNLAVFADARNLRSFEERQAELERVAEAKRNSAEQNKASLEDASVTVEASAGQTGKLFGTVTKEKISQAIQAEYKISVAKENIEIKFPIKTLGDYQVSIDLGSQISTDIIVKVVAA